MNAGENNKLPFYRAVKDVVRTIPSVDKILVLSDFKTRLRRNYESWTVIGRCAIDKWKSNGFLLLCMC